MKAMLFTTDVMCCTCDIKIKFNVRTRFVRWHSLSLTLAVYNNISSLNCKILKRSPLWYKTGLVWSAVAHRRHQAPVVQKVDNAIHRINHYPVDSVVCFVNTYPQDSDLSSG